MVRRDASSIASLIGAEGVAGLAGGGGAVRAFLSLRRIAVIASDVAPSVVRRADLEAELEEDAGALEVLARNALRSAAIFSSYSRRRSLSRRRRFYSTRN